MFHNKSNLVTARQSGKPSSKSNNAKPFVQAKLNFQKTNTVSNSLVEPDQDPYYNKRKRSKITGELKEAYEDIWEPFNDEIDGNTYDFFGDDFDKDTVSPSITQETVSSFSIHRLQVSKLERRFNKSKEVEIIDEIMKQVNAKYGQTREHFEKRLSSSQQSSSSASSSGSVDESVNVSKSQSSDYGFQIVVYIQKVYYMDKFLGHLDIQENHVRINKIIFYLRPREIFAITVGSTWQIIQPYSCYNFPYEISGRLTSTEGSIQETLKPLTGNVRSSKTTKKNASLFDQLNNVRYNVVKEVRPDSSIYWLKEFSWEDKASTKIRFGLAYLRIERSIKPGNIPEILNHFSLICSGQNTLTFPDAENEKHFDDLPMIRPVPPDEYKLASEYLYKLIYAFMHNHKNSGRMHDFDFSHKHVEDFNLACDFQLKYDNGHGLSYIVKEFSRCPTAFQLFSVLRDKCNELSIPDYSKFKARITSNVRISFNLNGRKHEGKVWDLLEGDVYLEQYGDFCRILGQWCTVRDEYHFDLHKKFLDILRKDSVLLYPGENGYLPLKWNGSTMKSVKEYVKSYEGNLGYFLPSTSSKDLPLFDLLFVSGKQEQNSGIEQSSVYLYYIFDRFDSGIRDSSTRVLRSLEALFTEESTRKSTMGDSLLKQFYHGQSSKEFKNEFPTFHDFQKVMLYGNMFVVVAYLTEIWRNKSELGTGQGKVTRVQPITNYFSNANMQNSLSCEEYKDNRIRSFYHERTLQLSFNEGNIQSFILKRISTDCKEQVCKELGISSINDESRLGSKLLDRLLEMGYCTGKDDSAGHKPISGKLLKIKNASDFKLFADNDETNRQVFKLIQRNFITQFPGFIHKLECFRIHENIMQWPRVNLRFAEIIFQP